MTWKNCFKAALLACLLAAGSAVLHAQEHGRALLLVASPALTGPYEQTALVVVPVEGKHIGFILNRATDIKLSTLFPGHAPSAAVAEPLYIGGPEMDDALFAMLRRDPGGQALQLFDGLFVTGRADAVNQIIEQTPNEARYFSGFVGWNPGELENEVERGLWYVTKPDSNLVFSHDTSGMWLELVKRLNLNPGPLRGPGQLETRLSPAK